GWPSAAAAMGVPAARFNAGRPVDGAAAEIGMSAATASAARPARMNREALVGVVIRRGSPLRIVETGARRGFVVDAGHEIAAAHSVSLVKAHGQYLFSPSGRPSGGLAALRNVSGTASGRINRFCTHPRDKAASPLRCGRERSRMTSVDELAVTTPDASAALAARAECQASVDMPTLGVALLVYGGWLASTLAYGRWPLIIVAPLPAVLIHLPGSLPPDIVHGHP